MKVPDGRESNPVHLEGNRKPSSVYRSREYEGPYECRVYDRHGTLLRVENREPCYYESNAAALRRFDAEYVGYVGPDEPGGDK